MKIQVLGQLYDTVTNTDVDNKTQLLQQGGKNLKLKIISCLENGGVNVSATTGLECLTVTEEMEQPKTQLGQSIIEKEKLLIVVGNFSE